MYVKCGPKIGCICAAGQFNRVIRDDCLEFASQFFIAPKDSYIILGNFGCYVWCQRKEAGDRADHAGDEGENGHQHTAAYPLIRDFSHRVTAPHREWRIGSRGDAARDRMLRKFFLHPGM